MHKKNEKRRLVGLETELLLVDNNGFVSNKSADVINHFGNTGNIVPEFCKAVIETNPPPSSSIKKIESNLLTELKAVKLITDSLGITEVPLSETGPGNRTEKNNNNRRYVLFEELMSEEHNNIERSCCGTHLHVDHNYNIVGEYNLLQSLDPVFILMSSSSYIRGKNSVNCGRVFLFRNKLFQGSPYMNQLLDYISSEAELEFMQKARSEFFLSKLTPNEEHTKIFGGYNNGSSPLRKTNHTIEIRCADSNIPSLAVAMAALYKGILEFVFEYNKLEIKISPFISGYNITNSEIFLPSYDTLKLMELEGLMKGPASQLVNDYLSYLIIIAEQGLPNDEVRYLQPFKEILYHKKNVANIICEKVKTIEATINGSISIESAAQVNLFIAEQYEDNINGGSQLIDMIRFGLE